MSWGNNQAHFKMLKMYQTFFGNMIHFREFVHLNDSFNELVQINDSPILLNHHRTSIYAKLFVAKWKQSLTILLKLLDFTLLNFI